MKMFMTDNKSKKKKALRPVEVLSFWQKVKLFFHYCPCGGKLWAWSYGKYKCTNCTKTYYI